MDVTAHTQTLNYLSFNSISALRRGTTLVDQVSIQRREQVSSSDQGGRVCNHRTQMKPWYMPVRNHGHISVLNKISKPNLHTFQFQFQFDFNLNFMGMVCTLSTCEGRGHLLAKREKIPRIKSTTYYETYQTVMQTIWKFV